MKRNIINDIDLFSDIVTGFVMFLGTITFIGILFYMVIEKYP